MAADSSNAGAPEPTAVGAAHEERLSELQRRLDEALHTLDAIQNGSVDLHIIHLKGADVFRDQLFSVGTSANVGEIPQCALLPDGKILIAATDLGSGPLANYDTTSFNKQGIGILDPISGRLTPLTITNGQLMPGVMNGLAASKDGKTCYFGCWVATGQGDVYSLPLPSGGFGLQVEFPTAHRGA